MDIEGIVALKIILFGSFVGVSFGATGSGGSVFAVPLLTYGLGLRSHQAVCISMVALGVMAWIGTIQNMKRSQIESKVALKVTVPAMLGAPIGAWINKLFSENMLMVVFAGMAIAVSCRMYFQTQKDLTKREVEQSSSELNFTSRGISSFTFGVMGLASGLLAGLMGIGGGFVIVPMFVLLAKLKIHRAVATSMLISAMTGISAFASHLFLGQTIPTETAVLFTFGSCLGFLFGFYLSKHTSSVLLQKIFSVVMFGTALFILGRTIN